MSQVDSTPKPVPVPQPGDSDRHEPPQQAGAPAIDPDQPTVITQRSPLGGGAARATAPVELGKLLAGERLNHFELREYVGGGGMGAVFRALDTMLNREVALKVLSRDQGADEETRRRFQNEAQSAARLDHENIARVYYVGEDRGLNYIVFEFIEGTNLRELVERRGPIPLAEAVSYTLQVADALAHAASRDVVHRDIKPSNVIVTADGRAKLVDMGLARLHQVQPDGEDLTASGVTLGTFDYISPEQARDPRSADVRSDIYSLGCTLYYVLTGRPPFPEGTVLQKLLQHSSDEPPDPREINPDLPLEASAIVRKMLAKDPRRRFQDPQELIDALCVMAELFGWPMSLSRTPVLVAPAGPSPLARFARQLPWLVPVTTLFVAVLVLHQVVGPALEAETGGRVAEVAAATQPEPDLDREPVEAEKTSGAATAGADSTVSPRPASRPPDDQPSVQSKRPSAAAPSQATPATSADGRAAGDGDIATTIEEPPRTAGEKSSKSFDRQSATVATDDEAAPATTRRSDAASSTADATPNAKPLPPSSLPPLDALPDDVLVVSRDATGPQFYPNLHSACAAARNGSIIELQYDGEMAEEPIVLANLKLTIRAKEGRLPVVRFRPRDPDPANRSMITLAGGSLKLLGVTLELELPREVPAESWRTLFDVQQAELLGLEKCVLTVRNAQDVRGAYHVNVAFFNVKSAPGADSMLMPPGAMPVPPVEIRLHDCIARGEAVFLHAADAQPLRLSWDNGLLATSETLLLADGGTRSPSPGGVVRVELVHVTAAVGGGLCRLVSSLGAPSLLDTDLYATDSIFLIGPGAPLIEQLGTSTISDFQQHLKWNGERNFYSRAGTFWKITDTRSANEPMLRDFESWKTIWGSQHEVNPNNDAIEWRRLPSVVLPEQRHTPVDYALDDRHPASNPALTSAIDRGCAGLRSDDLPAIFEPLAPPEADPSEMD